MADRILAIGSPAYACDIGAHVFPTEKYALVRERLLAMGALAPDELGEPLPATREQLLRVHTEVYLADLEGLRWTPRTAASELPLDAAIVRAYTLAAGGTLAAARVALARGAGTHIGGGFHHAFADRAEGFCYVNDLAVAARALQHEGAVERVAIVDLDVHQGNGTARIFEGDPTVFTLSIHQEDNYPVPKQRSTLDIGLANGTRDAAYLARLDDALDAVWEFRPDLVLYQAGADPYEDDQLGGLALTLEGLAARDARVLDGGAARAVPVVVTLGGGYARSQDDTVAIHAASCAHALRIARGTAR
jgi:acetoin utilization deacetylase AcuC-like enzyme